MGKITPSKAKNAIRRALFAEIEGALSRSDKLKVWKFFQLSCAYCGHEMDPSGREGHMDHLESRSAGGTDHISNTVLACRICNGDEKREMHWEEFLRKKSDDDATFNLRHSRIVAWVSLNRTTLVEQSAALKQEVESQVQAVFSIFDEALAKIRKARR
jgi:hypothetical protein